MIRRRKILSLFTALAIVASAFVACGDRSGEPGASGTDTGSAGTGKLRETVTLKWWHWGDPPKNGDAVVEALNAKSAKDIGVKIDFLWATGDDAKLKTALSTGADDDIAFSCSWFANFPNAAQKGQLYDITDLLNDYPELRKFIPDWVWDGATVDGRIYGVPTYKDVATTGYWYCNKEYVFDQAGCEEEFMAPGALKAVKTPLMKKLYEYMKDGHPYPHDFTAPFNYNYQGPRGGGSGDLSLGMEVPLTIAENDDTYTLQFRYSTPNSISELKTLCEWYQAGYCNQDCLQLQKEPEFCVVNAALGWKGAEKSVWGLGKDYTVAICQAGKTMASPESITGSMQAVFANSKHPAEALKFIEYMNLDEEYRNMLAYGVKGANWDENEDGTVTTLNSDWQPAAFTQATFLTLKPVEPAPATMYQDLIAQMETAEVSKLVGWVPDYTDCKNELAATIATWEKYKYELACGTMKDPDSYIAKTLQELNAVGFAKVTSTLQKQVDEFLKAKGINVPERNS